MAERDDPVAPTRASSDTAWLTDLFHGQVRRLVGALTVYTGSAGDAEELAQEAFARVYANRRRLRDQARAQSYLYSIAFNLARSRWRRRRALSRALDRTGDYEGAPAADERVLAAESSATTTAAVASLSPRQRACVVLHYYAELSVKEIGEALGISSNSVKTHLQRGLASLRTTLEAEDRT